jgi:hypothetical protein
MIRGVAAVASAGEPLTACQRFSVRLELVAARTGVDEAELARLLKPVAGVEISDGVVVVDAGLLDAVRL